MSSVASRLFLPSIMSGPNVVAPAAGVVPVGVVPMGSAVVGGGPPLGRFGS